MEHTGNASAVTAEVQDLATGAEEWAPRITASWQKLVSAIIDTGPLLLQAKADMPHGSFQKMIEQDLPFGPRTARMLMAIASHPVLQNGNNVAVLPPSWGTQAVLSQIPEDAFRVHIDTGKVHPKMTRAEAVALRGPSRKPKRPSLARKVAKPEPTPKWDNLDELAKGGHSSHQVARQFGVGRAQVMRKAAELGVTFRADQILGRTRHLDHNRILRDVAGTLESLVPSGCGLVNLAKVDRDVLAECIDVIDAAMRQLNRFRKRLKEEG